VTSPINEYVTSPPGPALRGIVSRYSGYRQRGAAPALHRGLPSPSLTLIFTIDEPLNIVQHVDRHRSATAYDAVIGGLRTSPVHIAHDGAQSGVQVDISPLHAGALLGAPAGDLADLDVDAELLLGGVVEQAREGLNSARSWRGRVAAVDDVLRRQLRDAPRAPDEVSFAWSLLMSTGGRVRMRDLARETGWCERHLTNRLRQATGLTPKRAARVIRFDRARRSLQSLGGRELSRVAVECGYSDQSHMSRDFVEMAGSPPGRWLEAEFGNFQSVPTPLEGS
jgi:AraC-like DNA-binding protein